MRFRFVTCSDMVSSLIRDREGEAVPFTPSHTELAVSGGYLGAHYDGGVAIRPVGYDRATMLRELFLDVPLGTAGDAAAEAFARSKIGAAYDWQAIVDFVLPTTLHENKHLICSAFMFLTAKAGGAFAFPVAVPAHAISPRDLLFLFSGRQAIPVGA
jgi:hypothetical protein